MPANPKLLEREVDRLNRRFTEFESRIGGSGPSGGVSGGGGGGGVLGTIGTDLTLSGFLTVLGPNQTFGVSGTGTNDGAVWNASKVRSAGLLSAAGTGTMGSANEATQTIQCDIPSTSAAAHYQKSALFCFARTADPSSPTVNRDATGADIRGWIRPGNMTGRVWGLYVAGQTEAGGDGQVQGIEIDIVNAGGVDVPDFVGSPTNAKVGMSLVSSGGPATCGINFNASGAGLWHKGIRAHPSVFDNGAEDHFLELDEKFTVHAADGNVFSAGILEIERPAGTDYSFLTHVAGDAGYRHGTRADGALEWGSGGAGPMDTTLSRTAAASLRTGFFESQRPSGPDYGFAVSVVGESFVRWRTLADGTHQWGPGNAAIDTTLSRTAAASLRTGFLESQRATAADYSFAANVVADTFTRWRVLADGTNQWGPGNAAVDTSMSRTAGGVLTTPGTLNHVAPEARVTHSVAQTLTTGVELTLAFDTERFDNDVIHDNATNNSRLICKTAGKYLIWGSAEFAANATGQRYLAIKAGATGSTYHAVERRTPNNGFATGVTVTAIVDMAVNDYAVLAAYQESGGALNVGKSNQYSPEFGMVKIG